MSQISYHFSIEDANLTGEEEEEKDESNFEFQSTFEMDLTSRLDLNFTSATECLSDGCDFYSQLQELKRINTQKLQQVRQNLEKVKLCTI